MGSPEVKKDLGAAAPSPSPFPFAPLWDAFAPPLGATQGSTQGRFKVDPINIRFCHVDFMGPQRRFFTHAPVDRGCRIGRPHILLPRFACTANFAHHCSGNLPTYVNSQSESIFLVVRVAASSLLAVVIRRDLVCCIV